MVEVIATLPKNQRERTRVALDTFQGVNLVDVRVAVQLSESSDVWSPTKRGVSLRIEQIGDLIAALKGAQEKAVAMGWLEVAA